MQILTLEQRQQMIANGRANAARSAVGTDEKDFEPVVKLFCPWNAATWLLSELDPDDPDIAFGLCDLGMGFPELGCVRLSEIEAARGPFGLGIERDLHFAADKTLGAYAEDARIHQRIRA